jgi:hypothetical protein
MPFRVAIKRGRQLTRAFESPRQLERHMPSEPQRPDNNGNMNQLKFFLFLCLAVSIFLNVASDDDSSTGRNLADLGMLFSFLTLVLMAALIARTFLRWKQGP